MKRALIATMAVLGLGVGHSASVVQKAHQSVREVSAIKNGESTRAIEQDLFGRWLVGLRRQRIANNGGCPPHIWGQSAACRRMVRHNRLRAGGLGGAHI